jgi:hypothetical protein
MNYLAQAIVVCMTISNALSEAHGGVSHGTYYACWFDAERVVVAIDSRKGDTVGDKTTYRDDYCKLLPLGTSGLFFAEGIIGNSDARSSIFEGFAMASKWHASNSHFGIQSVADAWGAEFAGHMQKLYPFYAKLLDARHGGEIVNAHFIGFDAAGRIDAIVLTVTHQAGKPEFIVATKHLGIAYTFGGHAKLVQEFISGPTPRAIAIRDLVTKEFAGKPISERYAIELRAVVQNVPLWAGDPGSGGEVAVAILERSTKTLKWFHKPAFCPVLSP